MWSGISVLASSLKRNVFLYYHELRFFGNQYVILGSPGLAGFFDHSAVNLAKEVEPAII